MVTPSHQSHGSVCLVSVRLWVPYLEPQRRRKRRGKERKRMREKKRRKMPDG